MAYLLAPPASAAPLNALDTATFAVNAWLANGFLVGPVMVFRVAFADMKSARSFPRRMKRKALALYSPLPWATSFHRCVAMLYTTFGKGSLSIVSVSSCLYINEVAFAGESESWSVIFLVCMLVAYASDSAADLVFLGITSPMMICWPHMHTRCENLLGCRSPSPRFSSSGGWPVGKLGQLQRRRRRCTRSYHTDDVSMDLRRPSGRSYMHEESDVADTKHRSLEFGI